MPAPPSCFAAIPVVATEQLLALQRALPDELRPIHPDDLHLTIAYFGRIDPALHPTVLQALAQIRFDGATVRLGSPEALPSRDYPSAIVLTLLADAGLDAVAALMQEHRPPLLELAGRDPEDREPLPHITFARPRGRQMSTEKRQAILDWSDGQPALDSPLDLRGIVLMRSRPPRDTGPYYEIVR